MTCKGMNCTSTDGTNHSPECRAEYAATIAGGKFVKSAWTLCKDALPPDETPVLIVIRGFEGVDVRVGELRWEQPSFEDTHQPFRYWDDPYDDGQDWQWPDVVAWQPLPEVSQELLQSIAEEETA